MNDRTYKPTVLHSSIDGIRYLCGNKQSGSWHEKWMSDKFASSLPLCEDCEEVKDRGFGVDTEAPPIKTGATFIPLTTTENILSSPTGLSDTRTVVSDYRRVA